MKNNKMTKLLAVLVGAVGILLIMLIIATLDKKGTEQKISLNNQQNDQTNATLIQYRAKFLDQCTQQYNQINASVAADPTSFKQEMTRAQQDCYDGHYSFDTSEPFECFSDIKDKNGKLGLLVVYDSGAYVDQCIKYNINLIDPNQPK